MPKIDICFSYPFVKPKQPCSLVVFCEAGPAVPAGKVKDYLTRCMEYARVHGVYLVPGRFIMKKRLCLCLLSPQGKPITLQKATHLNVMQHPELQPAAYQDVVETEFGKLALLVDVDIFHPEVCRSAAMQGAEILIASQYMDLYDISTARILSGCWDAAQHNQVTVIGVNNQSCCVCAPCAATQDKSGFVLAPQAQFPVLATVYPHKVQKLRSQLELLGYLNPAFCEKYAAELGR